jgi:chromosome segregation protein
VLLNRLELNGFKSFGKKTQVKFSPGITCVVGPNGCGKSNIADAIRWALGESNVRNLRGKSLSDVIFKGTREVNPSGMAEVILHIDNHEQKLATEFNEVAIQRRVFRSGESEFLINKSACRLKDIKSLFLDTGLGSSEYVVIEREMIDEVLADRDDARRFMIDETAGITRYKQRRAETLRKIKAVEGDLTRVEDVLEIEERQVRSLAYQMGKARRYKRLSDRIQGIDVSLARLEWQVLMDAASGESDRLAEEERQKSAISGKLHEKEALQENMRVDLLELGQALNGVRQELNAADEQLSTNREESLVRKERLRSLQERITDLSERIGQGENTQINAEKALAELAPQLEEFTEELGSKRGLVSDAEGEYARADKELRTAKTKLAERQQIHIEQVRIQSDTVNRIKVIEERLADLDQRDAQLAQQLASVVERSESLGAETTQLSERRDTLNRERETLTDQLAELDDRNLDLQARQRGLGEEIGVLSDEIARCESRLNLLDEQARSYEGFRKGVVQVLEHKDEVPGIIGAAAELLTIDPEWVHRLSPVLRDLTDWVVTESEAAAWDAIEWLRGRDLGQVTFVPMQELAQALEAQAGTEGLARAVIAARDESTEPLAAFLRQMIVPVKDRAEIKPMALRDLGKRWITETGEVFASDGWISSSGGSSPAERLWSRPQEMEALQDRLAELTDKRGGLENERASLTSQIEEISGQMMSRQNEMTEILTGLENLSRTLAQKQAEERLLGEESDRLHNQRHQIASRKETESVELEASRAAEMRTQQEAGSADERFHQIQKDVTCLEEDRDRLAEQLADVRMNAMVAETQLKDVSTEASRRRDEMDISSENVSNFKRNRQEALDEIQTTESRIEELHNLEGDLVANRDNFNDKVNDLTHDRGRKEDELGEIEKVLREQHRRLTELEESLRHDEVQLARAEADRQRLRDRIGESYGIRLNELPILVLPPADDEAAEEAQSDSAMNSETAEELLEAAVAKAIEGLAGRVAIAAATAAREAAGSMVGEDESRAAAVEREVAAAMKARSSKKKSNDNEHPLEGLSVVDARVRLDELRRDRERLGPVNQLAIEEYERKKEHVKFVKEQRDDLLQSRDSLLEAIERINTEAGRLFSETFSKVQENFATTFSTLFPGGEAKLRLAGDDPLEADIEIMARPRGKRLESIHLLSSGEKCLTATSLLFALYLVKPSPFCVLDEVDAPLDDANIDRFLNLLRKFSDRTQFIVITHNKRTMEVGDTLYGVTMQEPGISKLVSVKMESGEIYRTDESGKQIKIEVDGEKPAKVAVKPTNGTTAADPAAQAVNPPQ